METNNLIFNQNSKIELASNIFIDVPVILKYENENLIEVFKELHVGYTMQFRIYHPDGTYLTKIVGNRMRVTKEAEKAGVEIKKYPQLWVCTLNKKPLFEIVQKSPDSFKTTAELYTEDGRFIKTHESISLNELKNSEYLQIGGVTMTGNTFHRNKVGIWIKKDGGIALGVNS